MRPFQSVQGFVGTMHLERARKLEKQRKSHRRDKCTLPHTQKGREVDEAGREGVYERLDEWLVRAPEKHAGNTASCAMSGSVTPVPCQTEAKRRLLTISSRIHILSSSSTATNNQECRTAETTHSLVLRGKRLEFKKCLGPTSQRRRLDTCSPLPGPRSQTQQQSCPSVCTVELRLETPTPRLYVNFSLDALVCFPPTARYQPRG